MALKIFYYNILTLKLHLDIWTVSVGLCTGTMGSILPISKFPPKPNKIYNLKLEMSYIILYY